MNAINVPALDQALVEDFGSFSNIAASSLSFYRSVGVPDELILEGTLHPTGEYLAEQRYLQHAESDLVSPEAALAPAPWPVTGEQSSSAWLISSGAHAADSALRGLVHERVGEQGAVVSEGVKQASALEQSWQLLRATTPALAQDVAKYVKRVAITDSSNFVGLTWTDLGGLVVFGAGAHTAADKGAESLLHEALHTKSERLTRGFERVYLKEDEDRKLLDIPWRSHGETKVRWTPARTFDAFFVYAHLTVLRAGLYKADRSEEMLDSLRRVSFRAEYLSNALRTMPIEHVDEQRQQVVRWLDGIRLRAFDLTDEGTQILERASLTEMPV